MNIFKPSFPLPSNDVTPTSRPAEHNASDAKITAIEIADGGDGFLAAVEGACPGVFTAEEMEVSGVGSRWGNLWWLCCMIFSIWPFTHEGVYLNWVYVHTHPSENCSLLHGESNNWQPNSSICSFTNIAYKRDGVDGFRQIKLCFISHSICSKHIVPRNAIPCPLWIVSVVYNVLSYSPPPRYALHTPRKKPPEDTCITARAKPSSKWQLLRVWG